jgi:hypothetical protein
MGEMRNVYNTLVGKPEGMRTTWKNKVMELREIW